MTESTSADDRFPDFSAVRHHIQEQTGELMDINSELIRLSRQSIHALNEFVDRFNAIADSIREAHAIGAMMTSDLTTDMIMEEYSIEEVSQEELDAAAGEEGGEEDE